LIFRIKSGIPKHEDYKAIILRIAEGYNDGRVVPAHSLNFAASLQAAQSCDKPGLIIIKTKSGPCDGKLASMIISRRQISGLSFMEQGIET
jgi:prolyl oligopeptidase